MFKVQYLQHLVFRYKNINLLEIDLVREVCVSVCVSVCVYVPLPQRLLITSSVMWHDIDSCI